MKNVRNIVELQSLRQLDDRYNTVLQENYVVTRSLIKRLGLSGELEGHTGCVNCLEWSSDGSILASGSDDVSIILWDPFRKKKLTTISTGHTGNIFTVKFLPNTENKTVISGAADNGVRIHDVVTKDVIRVCTCHLNRVKRCVTDPISHMFWTAGEDGLVIEHDLRSPHHCVAAESKVGRNTLIDLQRFLGPAGEIKCIAMNPANTDQIAVGANDPYVRVFDRRKIKVGGTYEPSAAQYFVPGHLPSKSAEYKKKYRSLASTYIIFSPDGKELLVNLGGEQIYLFPMVQQYQSEICNLVVPDINGCVNGVNVKDVHVSNGYSDFTNSGSHAKVALARLDFSKGMRRVAIGKGNPNLTPAAKLLKEQANQAFEQKKYVKAVHLYNEGLILCPENAVLYSNRSAALLKRGWDGDSYAALHDCQMTLKLEPNYYKALVRMSRCLFELGRITEAAECLRLFNTAYPEHTNAEFYRKLEADINRNISPDIQLSIKLASLLKSEFIGSEPSSSSSSQSASDSVQSTNSVEIDETHELDSSDENFQSNEASSTSNGNPGSSSSSDSSASSASSTSSSTTAKLGHKYKRSELQELEYKLRSRAIDYLDRFVGHCNTTTDIKEANFFGNFIVAGSDDGSFYIWDKATTNIVNVLKGDESIVNCLQPHPSTCLLATSGIESVIRLWSPMSEEGYVNDRVIEDVNDAASANQKRMNSNPFEVILMNMGYRITGSGAEDEESEDGSQDMPMQCRQS